MVEKSEETIFGYKKLIAWQRANELAYQIYLVTKKFPKSELFGIISQLRRAGLSVPTNIVEGHARRNRKEFHRFLLIAFGSLTEVEYLLEFALRLDYLPKEDYSKIEALRLETGHILWKLIMSQKN